MDAVRLENLFFVPYALHVVDNVRHAGVLHYRSAMVWQREVRMPDAVAAAVVDEARLLIDERNSIAIQGPTDERLAA
jgi:hypothetical protein